MQYGAQLYTVRDFTQTETDFERTIAKIAQIGYEWVQLSAVGPILPERIRRICDENGVKTAITHTDPERIRLDTQKVIEEHGIFGADYIGLGSMPGKYPRTKDGVGLFAADYSAAVTEIARAGMRFMYHNHDFEFEKSGGKILLEHMADMFDKSAGFILDLFWIQAGGGDPAYWIERLSGRVDAIHFKDMAIVGGERRMCEIMEGNLNWERIYAACEKAGVKWALVEQDDCYGKDPFECLKVSLENMENYSARRERS